MRASSRKIVKYSTIGCWGGHQVKTMDRELLTYSDLYQPDVPKGALLIPVTVTANEHYSDGAKVSDFFCNNLSRYNKSDHFVVPKSYSSILTSQRHTCVTGSFLSVYAETHPCAELIQHWKLKLGIEALWKWGLPGELNQPHLVTFPIEHLPEHLHAIDPLVHYTLSSKSTLPQLTRCNAALQDPSNPSYPCVVKTSIGAGGKSVFFANDATEYRQITARIHRIEPKACIIVYDKIENIVGNYNVIIYVNKKGEKRWLGVTESKFHENGLWAGAHIDISAQPQLIELLQPTVEPIIDELHKFGYFGVAGIDVLVDKNGTKYIPDVNPRITGSTPSLLIARLMASRGWLYGTYIVDIAFDGTPASLFQRAEAIQNGEMVILGLVEYSGNIHCSLAIFARSYKNCQDICAGIFGKRDI